MKLNLFAVALISCSVALADSSATQIDGPGTYRLRGRTHAGKVVIVSIRVSATPSEWQKGALENAKTLITDVSIDVERTSLLVGRSAYADLANPSEVTLEVRSGRTHLIVRGGDGADSYRAVMRVDDKLVSSREIYSPLTPKEPTQRTIFWIRALRER